MPVEVWEACVVMETDGVTAEVVCGMKVTLGGKAEPCSAVAEARVTEGAE